MSRFTPASADELFASSEMQRELETEILPNWLPQRRWFGGKARNPQRFELAELLPLGEDTRTALIRVDYADGTGDLYQMPLRAALRSETDGETLAEFGAWRLVEALDDPSYRAALWRAITHEEEAPPSRLLQVEQSNSSLLYDDRVFVKIFRKLETGVNPDAEILRYLGDQGFPHVPAYAGALEHDGALLALAIGAVANRGDAWAFALGELAGFYERSQGRDPGEAAGVMGPALIARAAQLGTRTGELHRALATPTHEPDFAPEPLTREDLTDLSVAILGAWEPVEHAAPGSGPAVRARAVALGTADIHAVKTRTHGDYHLGQVLETGQDFVIIDFEGEPSRPLAERRRKRSPLRDVAGMLRSFHYAAHAARQDRADLEVWAEAWAEIASRAFLDAWLGATEGEAFRPAERADFDRLLETFLLEKAIYEIAYELNNRPAWLPIPLRGLRRLLEPA